MLAQQCTEALQADIRQAASGLLLAEAVPRCQEGLMRFYCSASQAPQLQGNSLAWREGELDEALCRAGLW